MSCNQNQIDCTIKQKIIDTIDALSTESTNFKKDAQNIYLLKKDIYELIKSNKKPVSSALNFIVAFEQSNNVEIE